MLKTTKDLSDHDSLKFAKKFVNAEININY